MIAHRQLIRFLAVFSIAKVKNLHAFYDGNAPTYLTKLPTNPKRLCLLFAGENEDGDIGIDIDSSGRKSRVSLTPQQRRRRRRRKINHQESQVTAAGAESLFSISISSWSSFFQEPLIRPRAVGKTKHTIDLDVISSSKLPSIDCEWACHSEEEIIQLQQMKLLLDTELETVVEKGLHRLYPDVYSDLRLLRFLRKSKERDINSSADRYRSFLKWRQKNQVDDIRAMVGASQHTTSSFTPPDDRLQLVADYFPMKFDYVIDSTSSLSGGGSSSKSNTVRPAILYVGSFDTVGISEKIMATHQSDVSLDGFLNYWIYLYESIHYHLYHQSIHFGKMMFLDEVCDLSGLSIKQFSPYFVTKIMKPWLRMTQSNYPETTRRIFILNPPTIVNVAWKLVTPLLSQGTVDKIRFEKKFKGSADDFCDNSDYTTTHE